ncbi:MAG: phosphatidylserine decarboxylase [Proteobacteria bacterium]|nr:phosphatidylserine decarboxylase [Pseudomonadota bacterium]
MNSKGSLLAALVGRAPLALYTRFLGRLAAIELPPPLRPLLLGRFAARLGIDLEQAELPLDEYASVGEFFARRLRPGARPVDPAVTSIVSPVDGTVTACGTVRGSRLLQAKGLDYGVAELLGDAGLAARFEGGVYLTIYLHPRDYHRIHVPAAGALRSLRRIAGELLPVQHWVVDRVPGLFVRNERVVFELEAALGSLALVCVGAAGVGSITTAVAEGPASPTVFDPPLALAKGQELAAFRLGSTVILLAEAGALRLLSARGDVLRMGQVVAQGARPPGPLPAAERRERP